MKFIYICALTDSQRSYLEVKPIKAPRNRGLNTASNYLEAPQPFCTKCKTGHISFSRAASGPGTIHSDLEN